MGRILAAGTGRIMEGIVKARAGVFRMCMLNVSSSSGSIWPQKLSFSWRTSRPCGSSYDTRMQFSVTGYIITSKSWSSNSFQTRER